MANDNQGSRTFLAIVLGGIVLALVIAAYFMSGHKGDSEVKVEPPASEQPVETPTTESQPAGTEAPDDASTPDEEPAETPAPEPQQPNP